jgi:hypothetical protein
MLSGHVLCRHAMVNFCVRPREEEPLVPVVAPAHDIRRSFVGSTHRNDFTVAVVLTHVMGLHHDPVSDGRSHDVLPSLDTSMRSAARPQKCRKSLLRHAARTESARRKRNTGDFLPYQSQPVRGAMELETKVIGERRLTWPER